MEEESDQLADMRPPATSQADKEITLVNTWTEPSRSNTTDFSSLQVQMESGQTNSLGNISQSIVDHMQQSQDRGKLPPPLQLQPAPAPTQPQPQPQPQPAHSPRKSSNAGHKQSHGAHQKQPQLLYKKMNMLKVGVSAPSDLIMSTNIEDMAISTSIPQWLIYSWTCKPKDKNLSDRKTQIAICELLHLKNYALPISLAANVPVAQQDAVARNLIYIFQNLHKTIQVSSKSMSLSRSAGSRRSNTYDRSNSSPRYSASGQGGDFFDSLASASVKLPAGIRRKDHCIAFLDAAIAEEVEETKSESTLFRSNNITSKLLTLYANIVAKDYLYTTLQEVIQKVLQMGSMEVDPSKITSTSDSDGQVSNNMNKLLQACQMVLDAVVATCDSCPSGLQKLCFLIQRQVESKFGMQRRFNSASQSSPNTTQINIEVDQSSPLPSAGSFYAVRQKWSAVSGFIFLRFICPAIVTPESNGLVSGQLTSAQRRNLVLISKVIQNLANGVKFGGKEAFMTPANVFLSLNEQTVADYCEHLQATDPDNVYWTTDSVQEAEDRKVPEFDAALVQILNSMNIHMEKIYTKLEPISINEVMTYTVFGALKSIVKRFELIERVYDITLGESGKKQNDNTQRDQDMLNNSVLLGGLEEVLLMNRYVLIKAILHPSNFITGRSALSLQASSAGNANVLLNREMDSIARSVVQVVGPHGGNKLVDCIEWVLDQELMKKQEQLQQQGFYLSDIEVLMKILEGPAVSKSDEEKAQAAQHNQWFGTSMTFKLIISFMFAHTKEYLKPLIQDVCTELWFGPMVYEIDPTQLKPDDNLKVNLDNVLNAAIRVVHAVTNSIQLMPECFRKLVRLLYIKLGGRYEDDGGVNRLANERAACVVSNFLFLRYYCPIVGAPPFYGIIPLEPVKNGNPNRTFVLISYMMRFLAGRVFGELFGTQQEVMPYESEILGPMIEEWKQCTSNFIRSIIHALPALPSGSIHERSESLPSLAESKQSKGSMVDTPVPISSSSRAKGLLFVRKVLTPQCVKHLKTMIDISESSKPSTKTRIIPSSPTREKSDIDLTITSTIDDGHSLTGYRIETIQYRLIDRVRIVLSSIYKEPESVTLVKEVLQARRQSNAVAVSNIPPIEETAESNSPPATKQQSKDFKTNSGFASTSNKARKGMPLSGSTNEGKKGTEFFTEETNLKLSDSQQAIAQKEPSRWSIMPNTHIASATKNIVKGIFGTVKFNNEDHKDMEDDLTAPPTDSSFRRRNLLSRSKSARALDDSSQPVPETERGIMSIIRKNRADIGQVIGQVDNLDITPPRTQQKKQYDKDASDPNILSSQEDVTSSLGSVQMAGQELEPRQPKGAKKENPRVQVLKKK